MLPIPVGENAPVALLDFTSRGLDISNDPDLLEWPLPKVSETNPVNFVLIHAQHTTEHRYWACHKSSQVPRPILQQAYWWLCHCLSCTSKWESFDTMENCTNQRNGDTPDQVVPLYLGSPWSEMVKNDHSSQILSPRHLKTCWQLPLWFLSTC